MGTSTGLKDASYQLRAIGIAVSYPGLWPREESLKGKQNHDSCSVGFSVSHVEHPAAAVELRRWTFESKMPDL
jgi:hypothetical protein